VHDAGIEAAHVVVEFGAGSGVLTAALARTGATVLAVEVDGALAEGLRDRVADSPGVLVFECDAVAFELPRSAYRAVANPPFNRTSAILHRLLDDPCGGLVRADLVVQWQVARARAASEPRTATDLVGTCWAPWWTFRRGRRIPARLFRPAPAVDAAVLCVTRRQPALLPPELAPAFAGLVRERYAASPASTLEEWVRRFSRGTGRADCPPPAPASRRGRARRAR
jgi:23S rRNA (adenine-N6)-dimethyltransferase